jgi:two-component system nitrate/nitrite response regulator NarL/two-component system response regulator NreC
MIAKGWDNVHIAAELNLAQQTVRNYISRIYAKIAVSSRSEAIVWTMKNSLAEEATRLVGSRPKN